MKSTTGILGASPYCMPCERAEHWIEISVVDEHNQPFDNIKGTLTDAVGNVHDVTLTDKPILIKTLVPGFTALKLDNPTWLVQSQQRKPYTGDSSDVDVAITTPGYQDKTRQLLDVTLGDFVELNEGQTLPTRHQRGETVRLITDNSYVVRVKGFNLLTLRLGMFFDGTTNNSYSAEWGKSRLDGYYNNWKVLYKQAKAEVMGIDINSINPDTPFPTQQLSGDIFTYPEDDKFHIPWHSGHKQEEETVDGSAANELTNVEKLKERYGDGEFINDVFVNRIYITGVGTGNSKAIAPADESVYIGQGLGVGEYGVVAKAETGIESVCESVKPFWDSAELQANEKFDARGKIEFDAIGKVEFDVFGFSRGSAAARHFINLVLDGAEGDFATAFIQACQKSNITLVDGFDWGSNENLEITFAGLFDTVAAITSLTSLDFSPQNTDNGGVRLWLDPERVARAVHLTAHPKTEYRANFCLNLLNTAPHFEEHPLPGAHSDIGGGYHASSSFDNPDYLLPRFERQAVERFTYRGGNRQHCIDKVKQKLEQDKQTYLQLGWPDSFNLEVKGFRGKENFASGTLYLQRVVEGDLSRLHLRIMYGLAKFHGVPVDDVAGKVWGRDKYLMVPDIVSGAKFSNICQLVLDAACEQGVIHPMLQCDDDDKANKVISSFMKLNLIHHSAADSIANHPHQHKKGQYEGQYRRQVFDCKKES